MIELELLLLFPRDAGSNSEDFDRWVLPDTVIPALCSAFDCTGSARIPLKEAYF